MDADPRAVNSGFPTESSLGADDLSSLAFGSSRGVRSGLPGNRVAVLVGSR